MAGWPSNCEISVVFPLPRNPVTSATGVLPSKARKQRRLERVERAPGQLLRLGPDRAEVADDGRAALGVAQDVHAAPPVVEPQAEMAEHPIEQRDAEDPRP